MKNAIENYFKRTSEALLHTDCQSVSDVVDLLYNAKASDATVFSAGNGGSAATASHMANDLIKGCRVGERAGVAAICLNDSSPVITCLANDFCYEDIFKIQLETLSKKGDVLCVFSGSGNSENVIRAAKFAKVNGLTVIGFLGRDGGKLLPLCDKFILAKTECMEQIEDIHLSVEHAIATALRMRLV